jgi:hypothetical protein
MPSASSSMSFPSILYSPVFQRVVLPADGDEIPSQRVGSAVDRAHLPFNAACVARRCVRRIRIGARVPVGRIQRSDVPRAASARVQPSDPNTKTYCQDRSPACGRRSSSCLLASSSSCFTLPSSNRAAKPDIALRLDHFLMHAAGSERCWVGHLGALGG